MTGIAKKIQIGVAACAIAAAAAFAPAGVAQADPAVPVPQVVGSALGSALLPECEAGEPDCDAIAGGTLFQNRFVWFGIPNPNPPDRQTVFTFTPIALIPGFLRPLWGFFTQNLNFEACVLGVSVQIGPYGSVTGSIGRGC
jgi:hypothetical protein